MSANEECGVCGGTDLLQQRKTATVTYKGVELIVDDHFSLCRTCGAQIATEEEMRLNKRAVIRARKGVDNIPLGEEIRRLRKRYGLTQEIAARLFGGGVSAFSKYENDDLIPDVPMVSLLQLALEYEDTIPKLAKLKGIELSYAAEPAYLANYFRALVGVEETYDLTADAVLISPSVVYLSSSSSVRIYESVQCKRGDLGSGTWNTFPQFTPPGMLVCEDNRLEKAEYPSWARLDS